MERVSDPIGTNVGPVILEANGGLLDPSCARVSEFSQMFIFLYIFFYMFTYVYVYLHIFCVFLYTCLDFLHIKLID